MGPGDLVVRHTSDAAEYLDRVGALLARRPVEHSVLLSVAAGRAARPAEEGEDLWLWVEDASTGERVAAAQHTPPYGAYLSTGPVEAARALARTLHDLRPELPGVGGLLPVPDAFAAEWERLGGGPASVAMWQGVYETDSVVPPADVPGRMRPAAVGEAPVLESWAVDGFPTEVDPADLVGARIAAGRLVVWDVDGVPVSMAAASPPQAGVSRVHLVYTPPDRRRRGYAGALVAALTARELGHGHRCMLYTDLANPTSNHIYREVGYRRVADAVMLVFGPPGQPGQARARARSTSEVASIP